ncbi:unnamed protein product [Phaeothamnion confervicola]
MNNCVSSSPPAAMDARSRINAATAAALGGVNPQLQPSNSFLADWTPLLKSCGTVAAIFLSILLFISALLHINRARTRRKRNVAKGAVIVAFMHPYCDGGGGGERVLWQAVHALTVTSLMRRRPVHILIYANDRSKPDKVLRRVQERFGIAPPVGVPLEFVRVRSWRLLRASNYPVFTMLGEALGSVILSAEALWRATPDVYFDSTGLPFTYLLAPLARCRVGAYVHYPMISADMLSLVRDRRPAFNNRRRIADHRLLSLLKLVYYRCLAAAYGFCGRRCAVVMVNSCWTRRHIAALWSSGAVRPSVIYPPCDTDDLKKIPLQRPSVATAGGPAAAAARGGKAAVGGAAAGAAGEAGAAAVARQHNSAVILSLAQFRPEKNHALQIEVMRELKSRGAAFAAARLVMVGGCRGAEDEAFVAELRRAAETAGVAESVEFVVGCDYVELRQRLAGANVGLHTMRDEHFGIGVVEMMVSELNCLCYLAAEDSPLPSSFFHCMLLFSSLSLLLVMVSAERGE